MKQTNYHLFDFLDFDTELKTDESLWKACKPTSIYEKGGDIYLTVPFQKQMLSNDMAADVNVSRKEYTLKIRYYSPHILRLYTGVGEADWEEETEMLKMASDVRKVPLTVSEDHGLWSVCDEDGQLRALINLREPVLEHLSNLLPPPQDTLDITYYPDTKKSVRLSA